MRRVVITGAGAVTPLGAGVAALFRSLLAGHNGIRRVENLPLKGELVKIGGTLPELDVAGLAEHYSDVMNTSSGDPHTATFMLAVAEAIAQSGLRFEGRDTSRVGCFIADRAPGWTQVIEQYVPILQAASTSGVTDYTLFYRLLEDRRINRGAPVAMLDSINHATSRALGITGPQFSVATACASGTNSIGEALLKIREGKLDCVIAGGAFNAELSSMIGFTLLGALTRNPDPDTACCPFDADRSGFVMGTGAGILVLESLDAATARGATILAEVTGYGSQADAYRATDPDPEASGAVRTMQAALDMSGLRPQDIGYINAHGTSTKMNDLSETVAIKRVFGDHAYRIPISSTKSMIGHTILAAGAIEAIVCVQSLATGMVHPTRNYRTPDPALDLDYVAEGPRAVAFDHALSNSFGFGGQNATIVISRYRKGHDS